MPAKQSVQALASGSRSASLILPILLLLTAITPGCSTRRFAANRLADALASSGSSYARDNDPELVRAATPFSLKLIESLLDENPNHEGLLIAAARGFTQYAYAFVQLDADEVEAENLAAAEALRNRAVGLYLRAHGYGMRSLEVSFPGMSTDPQTALASMTKADVPALYWTALPWAAAISLSKDNPDLVAQLPLMEAMMTRALGLDEAFGDGAIHSFFISYEMSRPGAPGDPAERAQEHFEQAVEFSRESLASPYVALAEAVAIQQQDAKAFERLLKSALAINVDAHPDTRLENLVMQRRAKWLLDHKADFILETEE